MNTNMTTITAKPLNYATLKASNYDGYYLHDAPEKVLQFGEGNFLRAFVEDFIDQLNEKTNFHGKVVVCQPIINGLSHLINEQEGLYHLFLRGIKDQKQTCTKRLISCVSRCINPYEDMQKYLDCAHNPDLRFIVSNTTEAGIIYSPEPLLTNSIATTFPGKLTQLLYERYQRFKHEKNKGFIILSCELIDHNGDKLKECVLAHARDIPVDEDFVSWILEENLFCSTLVDRIVTGYPKEEIPKLWEELGFMDQLIDTGECFGFWVIEGPESLKKELPFEEANLPVIITPDHSPYKERKVRILNGAHTSFVLGAFLSGETIVRDCMKNPTILSFLQQTIYAEIIPTLSLSKDELLDFANHVTDRFQNPFIDHSLLAISLNSTSKLKARVLPTLKTYLLKHFALPPCVTAAFAFYIAFYRGNKWENNQFFGSANQKEYPINDETYVLDFFYTHKDSTLSILVKETLANKDFWGEDLCLLPGLVEQVYFDLTYYMEHGALALMEKCVPLTNISAR